MHAHLPMLVLFAAHTASIGQYWHKLTDKTFTGIYHANFFDLAMMVPYFIVLFILAIYGMHRYLLVYNYYTYAKNVPGPPPVATSWPRVTMQLPIYNERYVIERLVEAISRFDYPRELLDVQVLDDSTDETQQVRADCVDRFTRRWACRSRYIHRANREGYKAGALAGRVEEPRAENSWRSSTRILFPPPDFLRRTMPYFETSEIGHGADALDLSQSRLFALTQVEQFCWTGISSWSMAARSRAVLFFNFNGTAGIWRRAAIEDAGGWQHDTLTEDTDLSYRAQFVVGNFCICRKLNALPSCRWK